MLVPGSHKHAYAANQAPCSPVQRQRLRENPVGGAGMAADEGIEICSGEGALILFNPMYLHSASKNRLKPSRYAYFTSFYDASANSLVDFHRETQYRNGLPDSLREGLPLEPRHLTTR
ncbi:MAG: hypothetical protein VX733_15545 [Candidatus Latescibacterota bacterium]|nr:hypothetical protein [Candidatus Latescibacterota bacterium]